MKVGDLIRYSDDTNDRLGVQGLVLTTDPIWDGNEIEPALIEVLWNTGEIERIFADEVTVVNV